MSIMRSLSLVFLMMLAVLQPCASFADEYQVIKEMKVPFISSSEIRYGDESRLFVSKDVEVFIHEDGGGRVSIRDLAAVGRIELARLYIKGATVVKIVVLEMAQ